VRPVIVSLVMIAALCAVPGEAAQPPVRVLYAGSLVAFMENGLGPAFSRATGIAFEGRGGGSVALAHMILDRVQTPDVFVSADPEVNTLLLRPPTGPSAPWFFVLARSAMVIAYNPHSRFADDLGAATPGHRPWYEILASPGFRLGRTDPRLDPKGYRTVLLFRLAERFYHRPGLEAQVLGGAENPAQIFPEEALIGRLESGQLDAGVFYRIEAVEQHASFVDLPDEINLGNPAMRHAYAEVTYTDRSGTMHRGGPILYTVTIPSTARNIPGAIRFLQFLYGPSGKAVLEEHGLLSAPALVGGDTRAVPPALRILIAGSYTR
jgi:molybdate/tungstate transport system substrate-binding protein